MKYSFSHGLLALALAAPLSVAAQQVAITAKAVNLRAGPDRFYPVVLVLPPQTQVLVQGCIPDYRWCDVTFGYERGWVYAGNLRYLQAGVYVPFFQVAPVIGITIFSFVIHDYWDLHYRERPWYIHRDRYVRPPVRVVPRVRPPAVVPAPVPPRVTPPARPVPHRIQPGPPAQVQPPVRRLPSTGQSPSRAEQRAEQRKEQRTEQRKEQREERETRREQREQRQGPAR
ncbi:MAG TPA: SH3 domain-containing protein [Ramlibacter sp.]